MYISFKILGMFMDYIEKFKLLIEEKQSAHFFKLWEEFCGNDIVYGNEIIEILSSIKKSSFLEPIFSPIAETALVLWEKLDEGNEKDEVLRLIFDLQETNSLLLERIALSFLSQKYSKDPFYNEILKIVGLKGSKNFKGAIRNYELLSHLKKNNFVFHSGGWGVGEVIEVSFLQKHVVIEFEEVVSSKGLSFENAFKSLTPMSSDHFLARRFGNPDLFEIFAKEHPVDFIKLLLKDLGPKTAQEIKLEVCELVIPENEWNKWWQSTRTKVKKDIQIIVPTSSEKKFALAEDNITHFEKLELALKVAEGDYDKSLLLIYNFIRDFFSLAKEKKEKLQEYLLCFLKTFTLQEKKNLLVSTLLILSQIFPKKYEEQLKEVVLNEEELINLFNNIFIVSLKKEFLSLIRLFRNDWIEIFIKLFLTINVSFLREFLFKELQSDEKAFNLLRHKLQEVCNRATAYPDLFLWLFFKSFSKNDSFFDFSCIEERQKCMESALILLHVLSQDLSKKEISKKLYNFLIADRFFVIRKMIEGTSIEFLKEFLLLSSKCPQFSKSDLTILQNLAEVVQPKMRANIEEKEDIFWVTQDSFRKAKERLQKLTGSETIENAKEIEEARALGDLRENSEYKFALEKRGHIQAEIKKISEGLNKSRILTKQDIFTDKVGIGCVVSLRSKDGQLVKYTLLGPWDTNPEKNILSIYSKMAQQMLNLQLGNRVVIQEVEYLIEDISSFLD